jgi:hypothetical protein
VTASGASPSTNVTAVAIKLTPADVASLTDNAG